MEFFYVRAEYLAFLFSIGTKTIRAVQVILILFCT